MIATRGFALIFTLMMTAVLAQRPDAAAGAGALPVIQLNTITARAFSGGASLVVETSEPTGYVTSRPNPLTILIDLRNVDGRRVANSVDKSLDAAHLIAAVTVEAAESLGSPVARVRVSLAQPLPYQVRSERNTIVLDLGQGAPRAATLPRGIVPPAGQAVQQAPILDPITALGLGGQPLPARAALLMPDQAVQADPAPNTVQISPPAPPQTAAGLAAQAPQSAAIRNVRTYSGNPISLDFQGADLRAVLRMFSEISGLNIVIDPAVQGTVDVMLTEVPWDQALDIILRTNKLGYLLDGTIARIAPLSVLADEEAQKRKLADEQALGGDLHVLTKTLSYAKAEELQVLITKTALSRRGTVEFDRRTNTLIVTDLQERLNTAESLLNTLDIAQPQVEIEARIVQTTKDYGRQLGVTWGFAGRATPALGNTTNLAFPNSVGVNGGIVPSTDNPVPANTAVSLGVAGATSAVGLALGSINGAFNLDVALSALESSGNGKILSTPRVSTQNNTEAEITQGIQIPIQTVSNNTVTVTFKDAALTLKVTPQITAAGTVIMKIAVENASPDFSRAIGSGLTPPINTQRANTTVLVMDGETTVIGGIYKAQEDRATARTPGLSRLPFLSWLFKRDTVSDTNSELLIFITPRITKA